MGFSSPDTEASVVVWGVAVWWRGIWIFRWARCNQIPTSTTNQTGLRILYLGGGGQHATLAQAKEILSEIRFSWLARTCHVDDWIWWAESCLQKVRCGRKKPTGTTTSRATTGTVWLDGQRQGVAPLASVFVDLILIPASFQIPIVCGSHTWIAQRKRRAQEVSVQKAIEHNRNG